MFRTFIISSLALLLMTNPAAAKTIFPVVGGSGDAGFQDHCPANEYMTGLAGRAGKRARSDPDHLRPDLA